MNPDGSRQQPHCVVATLLACSGVTRSVLLIATHGATQPEQRRDIDVFDGLRL